MNEENKSLKKYNFKLFKSDMSKKIKNILIKIHQLKYQAIKIIKIIKIRIFFLKANVII